jgi:hypothetical protein
MLQTAAWNDNCHRLLQLEQEPEHRRKLDSIEVEELT